MHRAVADADLFLLNLECCVSDRGAPVNLPGKAFFFRAPPRAADVLAGLGVDAVSLANNHALDFGPEALLDTRDLLGRAGLRVIGAGATAREARAPLITQMGGLRLGLLAVTDHPAEYAADTDRSGVAYADLWNKEMPDWLVDAVRAPSDDADLVLVSVHWGPNMTTRPVAHVRRAAAALTAAGADLVLAGFTTCVSAPPPVTPSTLATGPRSWPPRPRHSRRPPSPLPPTSSPSSAGSRTTSPTGTPRGTDRSTRGGNSRSAARCADFGGGRTRRRHGRDGDFDEEPSCAA